jgi:hypothetical protein
MIVEAQLPITGTKAATWSVITDIEGSQKIISAIEGIEIVEQPESGIIGLRWRETRMLFGKPATVEKWITEVSENESYETRAVSDGFVFITTSRISGRDGDVILTSRHESQPQTIATKLMAISTLLLFKGVIRKAILKDLNDIKATVERQSGLATTAHASSAA